MYECSSLACSLMVFRGGVSICPASILRSYCPFRHTAQCRFSFSSLVNLRGAFTAGTALALPPAVAAQHHRTNPPLPSQASRAGSGLTPDALYFFDRFSQHIRDHSFSFCCAGSRRVRHPHHRPRPRRRPLDRRHTGNTEEVSSHPAPGVLAGVPS